MTADWDTSGFRDRPHDEREDQSTRRRFDWFGGRRRLALITGLVSLAIVGAFIWSGREHTGPEQAGEPPLIRADETPIRVPPENPGGMDIPHRDKLVYQRLPGEGENPRMERLLPPPEEPLPPPASEPATSQPGAEVEPALPPSREAADEDEDEAATSQSGADGRGAPTGLFPPPEGGPVSRSAAAPPPRPGRDGQAVASAAPHAAPGPGAGAGAPRPLLPPGAGLPSPATGSPSPPPRTGSRGESAAPGGTSTAMAGSRPPLPQSQPTAQSTPAGGGYMVQLLAVGSVDQAQAAWTRLNGRNADILGGLSPSYVRADLGARGVIYRLRAGPVGSETSARALCAELAGRNVDCMIVRPGG